MLDRELLERLERLTLRWQKSFRGLVGGHNRSRYSGPGQEFLDHRHFHPGDDLRAVNWRAYMRLEKLFLKMFQIEPRTPIRLLLDCTASMSIGAPAKFDYARQLAAALTYVGLVRHDTLTLQPYRAQLEQPFTASGGRQRFGPVSDYLSSLLCGGQAHLVEMVRSFLAEYPQPGLVLVISDFLCDEDVFKPLHYLADFGHELFLIQVWDEEERTPAHDGEVHLVDAETEAELKLSLDPAARAAYTKAFDQHSDALEQLALRFGGRYAGLSTRTPLDQAIFFSLDSAGAALERSRRPA